MKYDLVGYHLGSLEAQQQAEVEAALVDDPQLRQQLEMLIERLRPLEACRFVEPPAGLAQRASDAVGETAEPVTLRDRMFSSGGRSWSDRSRWSMIDSLFAVGLVLVLALLLFPAVLNSRYMAKIRSCQDNLRQIGSAMQSYSDSNHGYFPVIQGGGKMSMAGAYAPILAAGGYIDGNQLVYCPAVQNEMGWETVVPLTEDWIAEASRVELDQIVSRLSGNYGYNPGYVRDGRYQPHRNLQRGYFPVVADLPGRVGSQRVSSNHGGLGQNVLFEDGSVRFLRDAQTMINNMLYLSERGRMELGRNPDDSVIVEGHVRVPPVVFVGQ